MQDQNQRAPGMLCKCYEVIDDTKHDIVFELKNIWWKAQKTQDKILIFQKNRQKTQTSKKLQHNIINTRGTILLYSPKNLKNQNFEKKEKNHWRYHHFTHEYQKLQSYGVQFLR